MLSKLERIDSPGKPVEGLENRRLFAAGLVGQYYGDTTLTKLDLTRTDSTVNFQWGTAAPNAAVPADNFSARWTGEVSPTSTRSYTFSVLTDGGTRLYINNQLVVNHWAVSTTGQVSYASSAISLTAGREYNLRLEFFSTTGAADIAIRWQSSVTALAVIPTTSLVTTYVDTTAPSVPTGISASGTSAIGTTLAWTPSTDDVGTTSYDIFRNKVKVGTSATASYTDTGLAPSTTYSYTIDARDAAGNVSAASTTFSVKTTTDTTAPTPPTLLHVTSATMSALTIGWTAATDNVGVIRYDIYRAGTKVGSSTTTSYTDSSGLTPSTNYSYTIKAADAAGNVSAFSTPLSASTTGDTVAPSTPGTLKFANLTYNSLTLSWTASTDNVGVTGYDIVRNGSLVTTVSGLSYTDTGLTGGTAYSYTVDARDAAGNVSGSTAALKVTTPPAPDNQPPSTPAGFSVTTATDTSLALAWAPSTDNVGVVQYDIYRGGTHVGTSTTASYTDTGLLPNVQYGYVVTATDGAGNTSTGNIPFYATTALDTQPPSAPTGLSFSNVSYQSATLSWSAATDDVGVTEYDLYRGATYVGTTTQLSLTDTGVSGGVSYTYTVDAQDAAGNVSLPSVGLVVQTPSPPDTTAPLPPTNLVESSETATTVTLDWDATTDDVGVAGYYVYRNGVQLGPVAGTEYVDSGLQPVTAYTYTVTAFDAAQNESGASNSIQPTTLQDTTPPSVPRGFSVSNLTYNGFTLTWSASTDDVGVASYEVYCNGQDLGPVTGTTLTETALSPSTTYSFQLDASDQAGNVSQLNTAYSVMTPAAPDTQPPTVPTLLTPTGATMTTLGLSWTASTDDVGVVRYDVYRNSQLVGSSTTTSFTDTGLTPGVSYNYYVTAADAAGNISQASTTLSTPTAPDTQVPLMPTGLKVTATTTSTVALSWSPTTDNVAVTGYTVLLNGNPIASTASTTYTNTGLAGSMSYSYTVEAYDAAGNVSTPSSAVTGTTMAAFTTWYADASGATPGSTKTIAAAYANAKPGDLVLVEPGTYKESLNLTRSGTATAPITIQAATAGTAILDGGSSLNTGIYGTATYIDVVGLTIQHYKTTSYQNGQAAVRTASGWQLINDTVQDNSGTGIGVFGSNIVLTNVMSQYNGTNGIGGQACTNVILTNCTSQYNNLGTLFTNHDPTNEGGGGKWFSGCSYLTFINYHGDNNCGPGVWFDWENSNITMINCEGSGNHGGGPTNAPDWVGAPVMIEANYGPVTITNFNGSDTNTGGFCIFETPNVTVTQSTLMCGLSFRDTDRGIAQLVDNADVITNNTIGYVILDGTAPTNLTLDYNNYLAPIGYPFFQWTGGTTYSTLAALQNATGFEIHGTLAYITYP